MRGVKSVVLSFILKTEGANRSSFHSSRGSKCSSVFNVEQLFLSAQSDDSCGLFVLSLFVSVDYEPCFLIDQG